MTPEASLPATMIRASGIEKAYGSIAVLGRVDLEVRAGEIFALLGPNGAGKTTMVNILTTLVAADAGEASVAGYDVAHQAALVRTAISLTGQYAAVDEFLTGEENLRMMARLNRLDAAAARARIETVLGQFDLNEVAARKVGTYSGGTRRRLDLAISLIAQPPLIFLDEPTTGLDPRSRMGLWKVVRELAADGTTIFLTTQYLEEADQLADRIAVIDAGAIIAEGTADDLKRGLSGERVELTFTDATAYATAARIVIGDDIECDVERLAVSVGTDQTVHTVKQLLDLMGQHDLPIDNIAIVRPSLDDVFLALTGHLTTEVAA
jgi:ABC-2 type transport system ATP-binding protein